MGIRKKDMARGAASPVLAPGETETPVHLLPGTDGDG